MRVAVLVVLVFLSACGDDESAEPGSDCMPDPGLMQAVSDAPSTSQVQGRPLQSLEVGRRAGCDDPPDAGACSDLDDPGCENPFFSATTGASLEDLLGPCACLLDSGEKSPIGGAY